MYTFNASFTVPWLRPGSHLSLSPFQLSFQINYANRCFHCNFGHSTPAYLQPSSACTPLSQPSPSSQSPPASVPSTGPRSSAAQTSCASTWTPYCSRCRHCFHHHHRPCDAFSPWMRTTWTSCCSSPACGNDGWCSRWSPALLQQGPPPLLLLVPLLLPPSHQRRVCLAMWLPVARPMLNSNAVYAWRCLEREGEREIWMIIRSGIVNVNSSRQWDGNKQSLPSGIIVQIFNRKLQLPEGERKVGIYLRYRYYLCVWFIECSSPSKQQTLCK